MYIPYSLYLAPGGLFISGPFEGGLSEGEGGAYLFIQKTSDGDYLLELQ